MAVLLLKQNFCFARKSLSENLICTTLKVKDFELNRGQHSFRDVQFIDGEVEETQLDNFAKVIAFYKDSHILYNCLVERHKLRLPHYEKKKILSGIIADGKRRAYRASVPLIVEYLQNQEKPSSAVKEIRKQITQSIDKYEQFPFAKFENIDIQGVPDNVTEDSENSLSDANKTSVREDIAVRMKAYDEKKGSNFPQATKHPDEELELRLYEDTLLSDLSQDNGENKIYINEYGTPDPNIPKSSIPCGGCGAFLHCQDEGLPGYSPSEMFSRKTKVELRALLCQRCFFLKRYKTALNVRVSPDVYEKALKPIAQSRALVVVVVDLLDMPCSIWPGLFDLIGTKRPVVVVGNKVDLLPLDNPDYLKTIKNSLIESIKDTSLWKTNIRHSCLISAKTGYGVEDLITRIQVQWGTKGDVYIVGCTNAGKSSLFNALLRSDMCQVKASSLIRRATSSPWPGTTLNLLKFPLLKPSGKRLFDRTRRLTEEANKKMQDSLTTVPEPRKHRVASLTGHIGQTFCVHPVVDEESDPFHMITNKIVKDPPIVMGINEEERAYADSKWCYDTPGTVQPDQMLGLLSHDELLDVLPREMISPRTYSLFTSQSLFIGGVARLDLLYTPVRIRVTVCCSSTLPVTIVRTSEASSVYRSYLGSDLFRVPRGNDRRFQRWPSLKPTNVYLQGKGRESVADIVLSSAGFISIAGEEEEIIDMRGWTPGGRGVYVRCPSVLPFAFNITGKKIGGTPSFHSRPKTFAN